MRVRKTTVADQIKIMDELGVSRVLRIACDHNNEAIDLMKAAGYNADKATDKHIESGIARMLEFNIVVNDQNVQLKEEFALYCYKNGKPIDNFNHGIDAIRYAIMDEFGTKAIEANKSQRPAFRYRG